MQELHGAQHGRLVVGTLAPENSYLIAPLVSQFKQQVSGVHLQFHPQASADIATGLLANRLDEGICLLPRPHDQLATTPLYDEQLVLVAPTRYPLPQFRMRMQDLGGLRLVLISVDYCLRKMMETECVEAQIKTQVVLEMTSPEGILQAVAEGARLTMLPEHYVRLRLAGSGLRIINLCDPVPRHSVGLAYLANRRYHNIATRDFGTLCRTTMTRLLARQKHRHRSTLTIT